MDAAVVRVPAVGSTNDAAFARLREGGAPVWVVAERQTAGRGRRGRAWDSPPGNLYASFAFPATLDDTAFALLPLAAALALAEAVAAGGAIAPALKWPNDVLVDGRKTAGILLECEGRNPRPTVIGFGVNVAHAPAGATHLAAHDPAVTPEALFQRLAGTLAAALATLGEPGGVGRIREQWLARAVGLGQPVTVHFERVTREGRFVGLDPAGRLMLADAAGRISLVAAGDVFLRSHHE